MHTVPLATAGVATGPPDTITADHTPPPSGVFYWRGQLEENKSGRLVTVDSVQGHLAQWAVRQHPYHRPFGILDAVEAVGKAAEKWTEGFQTFRMQRFADFWAVSQWVKSACEEHCPSVLQAWNTPRSKHGETHVFCSRDSGPAPEDDFIDLDALFRNVGQSVWREAEEIDASDARIEARIQSVA